MLGVASFSLLPSLMIGESKVKRETQNKRKKKIIFRTLGRTGIKVPIISMGLGNTGNQKLVQAALDAGIVNFDKAPTYMGGNSDASLREAVKGRPRNSFIVATKCNGFRDSRTGLIPKMLALLNIKQTFL
jgi:aryl-alcohol dehydrogenase-like predicted oxidoreductase